MKFSLLSAACVLTACSIASAHIEEFDVEVADWFVTGAALAPGGASTVLFDGAGEVLTASGVLGPITPESDAAIVQLILEGHIHGEIEEGMAFRVDYNFNPDFAAGSLDILGGQLSVEALTDDGDGSLFGLGSLPTGSALFGSFETTALELVGGPIIANHSATEADFVLAINFGWSGVTPADLLSLAGTVTVTPVPAPATGATLLAGCFAAARRRR
ncbi:MAG: hypothetical protein H6812_13710 [Phycisphaeraceae bacterium]|nr:hypothetical protein [Phycisphaerales bacterium]MCB9844293.1 hypothetical protein [Phycisphaeraceae bacterium]